MQSPESTVVLLVEDQEYLRILTRRILEQSGFRVIPARHAMDALILLEQHADEVDVILSDVLMPQMNGIAFAEQVRTQYPRLGVVLMSGHGAEDLNAIGADRWPGEILPKPFTSKQLVAAVRAIPSADSAVG